MGDFLASTYLFVYCNRRQDTKGKEKEKKSTSPSWRILWGRMAEHHNGRQTHYAFLSGSFRLLEQRFGRGCWLKKKRLARAGYLPAIVKAPSLDSLEDAEVRDSPAMWKNYSNSLRQEMFCSPSQMLRLLECGGWGESRAVHGWLTQCMIRNFHVSHEICQMFRCRSSGHPQS